MYRYVILFCSIVAVRADARSEMMPASCARLSHRNLVCCKKEVMLSKLPREAHDQMKECFQLENKFPSCDRDTCFQKKKGLLSEDGTLNKEKAAEELENNFKNNPEIGELYKENCLFGDLSKYGPPDVCDMMKQHICFEVQLMKTCDDWKEDGNCSGVKEMVEECLNEFS